MFVKIAQAAVLQAKLATFSVETLSSTLLELSVYMTRLGSAQYAWSAWRRRGSPAAEYHADGR